MNDLPESPRVARNRRERHGRAAKAQHVANLGTHLAETVDELNEVLDHYGASEEAGPGGGRGRVDHGHDPP